MKVNKLIKNILYYNDLTTTICGIFCNNVEKFIKF